MQVQDQIKYALLSQIILCVKLSNK